MKNDVLDFSKRPDIATKAAGHRVIRVAKWFDKIFRTWHRGVVYEKRTQEDRRECLTDKFPDDSPGNLNKESVSETFNLTGGRRDTGITVTVFS